MLLLELIELLCMFQIIVLLILINLELSMFLKRSKNLLEVKTDRQIYTEYKQIVQ